MHVTARLTASILELAIASVSVTAPSHAELAVSPPTLEAALHTGQTEEHKLTLSNSGASPIPYAIRIEAPQLGSALEMRRSQRARLAQAPRPVSRGPVWSPEQARPLHAWHAGEPALRPWLERPRGAAAATAAGLRVLILNSGAGVLGIKAVLAALPDVAQVDIFDGQLASPTAADLAPYDAVLVVVNVAFLDPAATGNALADYVDAAGSVLLTLSSFVAGWQVGGRFASGGYLPLTATGGPMGGATLGSFDPQHPIMAGVTAAGGSLVANATLEPGADLVASWNNGEPFVATRGRGVVALNLFVVDGGGYWNGHIPTLLANAMAWSAGMISWLSASPDTGVVAPGRQATATVRFDAAQLAGRVYDAVVVVDPLDAATAAVRVPARLVVTGAPDLRLAGRLNKSESTIDFLVDGASTTHALAATVVPAGEGTLEVVADGDFGLTFETAIVSVEGRILGTVGPTGVDCSPATATFTLAAGDLASWAADQVVAVTVQNSFEVNAFCAIDRHTVRLRYSGAFDELDFGTTFLGGCDSLELSVSNIGSEPLQINLASDRPEFQVPAFLEVAPGQTVALAVRFCPAGLGVVDGALTLITNDLDQPSVVILLRGKGVPAPDIEGTTETLSADLLTGETAVRTLTLHNAGGDSLAFTIDLRALTDSHAPPTPVRPGHAKTAPASADRAPKGWTPTPAPPITGSASVLLIQDSPPWGTTSNEIVLHANGIPFVSIPTGSIASTDLSDFDMVIVAGDQSTASYATIAGRQEQLAQYVAEGGVLDFHGAGWAWAGGEASLVTLPGGMHIQHYYSWSFNNVVEPNHPMMAGVPHPFTGTPASHAIFLDVPPGADHLASNEQGGPTLVVYSHGAGTVIASTQPLEYGYAFGQQTGLILANLIPYPLQLAPGWLAAEPRDGRVPPGRSAEITVTFDAHGLNGGDYAAQVVVASNDPDEPVLTVPVNLVVADVSATVQVLPQTVNLHPLLRWMMAELESPAGHGPGDVVQSSVRFNREATPDPGFGYVGDQDHDGIPNLTLRFLRSAAVATLPEGDPTPVVITGNYGDGLRFLARDELRVVRARFVRPEPGQWLVAGTATVIEWTVPDGWLPSGADLFWSHNDGITWQPIAMGVGGSRFTWMPPEVESQGARVRVALRDQDGLIAVSTSGVFRIGRSATAAQAPVAAGGRWLLQNAPNPSHSGAATSIGFRLPEGTRANLRIYNLAGQMVRVLVDGWLPAGDHLARWDGRDRSGRAVGSGIYFYRLDAGGLRESRRMTLLR